MISDRPEAWWRLDDPPGATLLTDAMGRHDGVYQGSGSLSVPASSSAGRIPRRLLMGCPVTLKSPSRRGSTPRISQSNAGSRPTQSPPPSVRWPPSHNRLAVVICCRNRTTASGTTCSVTGSTRSCSWSAAATRSTTNGPTWRSPSTARSTRLSQREPGCIGEPCRCSEQCGSVADRVRPNRR